MTKKTRRFQATRNGQYIGAPQATRQAAEQIIAADKVESQQAANAGWITQQQHDKCWWYVEEIR